jgi:shikimate dehydrogenase
MDAIRVLGIEGLSVTMPHKADAASACDELRGDAAQLRSVNCVSRRDGGILVGESTDGEGFLRSLREAGHEPAGATALVLGAGGAARAVVLALARAGARVTVAARRADSAADAAALASGIEAVSWDAVGETARANDLIVNATPIGMGAAAPGAEPARLPLVAADLGPGQVVADLVYHPRRTPLLELAAARGAATVEGVGMLVHQGAIAFERWTAVAAPVSVMRDAVLGALEPRHESP